ncbi:MAG: type IV pilus assembly protein FimV [Francisellaceae bacterium]
MIKKCILSTVTIGLIITSSLSFGLTAYTVEKGDSLWKVANKHKIKGIDTKQMIEAIKGINSKENPSINDNLINIDQKLAIPTTSGEVTDGIKLYKYQRQQYIEAHSPPVAEKLQPKPDNSSYAATTAEKTTSVVSAPIPTPSSDNQELRTDSNSTKAAIQPQTPSEKLQVATPKPIGRWVLLAIVILILLLYLVRRSRKNKHQQSNPRAIKERYYGNHLQPETQTRASADELAHQKQRKDADLENLLSQADRFIAERDIQRAKAILQEALNLAPKNLSIRIKLLSVYGADNDIISFNSERDYLASNLLPYDDERWREIDQIYQQYFAVR